jgi:hypothetical protein
MLSIFIVALVFVSVKIVQISVARFDSARDRIGSEPR